MENMLLSKLCYSVFLDYRTYMNIQRLTRVDTTEVSKNIRLYGIFYVLLRNLDFIVESVWRFLNKTVRENKDLLEDINFHFTSFWGRIQTNQFSFSNNQDLRFMPDPRVLSLVVFSQIRKYVRKLVYDYKLIL